MQCRHRRELREERPERCGRPGREQEDAPAGPRAAGGVAEERLQVGTGTVATYVHSAVRPGLGTIGVLLALMGISLSNSLIDFYPVRKVLAFISIYARYAAFTNGIFDFSAAFYYLSICAIFLFLAYRVYEKRRWS